MTLVVDTGSTFSFLPAGVYDQVTSRLDKAVRPLGAARVPVGFGRGGAKDACYEAMVPGKELKASDFPALLLEFSNGTLALGPQSYLFARKGGSGGRKRRFCLLFQKTKGKVVGLGNIMLEDWLVEFSSLRQVTFMPCRCKGGGVLQSS